jgi:hypothetical protein
MAPRATHSHPRANTLNNRKKLDTKPAREMSLTLPPLSAKYPAIGYIKRPARGLNELTNPICSEPPPRDRMKREAYGNTMLLQNMPVTRVTVITRMFPRIKLKTSRKLPFLDILTRALYILTD